MLKVQITWLRQLSRIFFLKGQQQQRRRGQQKKNYTKEKHPITLSCIYFSLNPCHLHYRIQLNTFIIDLTTYPLERFIDVELYKILTQTWKVHHLMISSVRSAATRHFLSLLLRPWWSLGYLVFSNLYLPEAPTDTFINLFIYATILHYANQLIHSLRHHHYWKPVRTLTPFPHHTTRPDHQRIINRLKCCIKSSLQFSKKVI